MKKTLLVTLAQGNVGAYDLSLRERKFMALLANWPSKWPVIVIGNHDDWVAESFYTNQRDLNGEIDFPNPPAF